VAAGGSLCVTGSMCAVVCWGGNTCVCASECSASRPLLVLGATECASVVAEFGVETSDVNRMEVPFMKQCSCSHN